MIGLEHQHGRRFIVLEHQYGCRDVMWKRSICWLVLNHPFFPANGNGTLQQNNQSDFKAYFSLLLKYPNELQES